MLVILLPVLVCSSTDYGLAVSDGVETSCDEGRDSGSPSGVADQCPSQDSNAAPQNEFALANGDENAFTAITLLHPLISTIQVIQVYDQEPSTTITLADDYIEKCREIAALQTSAIELQSKVTITEASITSLQDKVTKIEATKTSLEAKINTFETENVTLNATNAALGFDSNSQKLEIATLKSRIMTLAAEHTGLESKVASMEAKNKALSSSLKYYQKERIIRQARQKEYAHGIYTGQTSPKLVYGKEEFPSACLSLIGKKSYLQLRIQGHKNDKVQGLIAAAVPEQPAGPKRGGRRGNKCATKETGKPTIEKEVQIPAKETDQHPGLGNFEESEHEEDLPETQAQATMFESYKSTFSDAFDAEKVAYASYREKSAVEVAEAAEKRWKSNKEELMKIFAKSNNARVASTVPTIVITPTSNSSTNTDNTSMVSAAVLSVTPVPECFTSTPAADTTPALVNAKTWTFGSILGLMFGW